MEKFESFKRKVITMVGKGLTPIILKHLTQMISEDLQLPPDQRVWSGPNKNVQTIFEDVLQIARSDEFRSDLKNKIRMQTMGLAFAVDLNGPIDDALHAEDFYEILFDVTESIVDNSKLQRILGNPSVNSATKMKQIQPVLKSEVDVVIHKLVNNCYDPSYRPDPKLCGSSKNFLAKKMSNKKMNTLLTKTLDTQLQKQGARFGMNLSQVSALNVASKFFRKTRKSTKGMQRKAARKTRHARKNNTVKRQSY